MITSILHKHMLFRSNTDSTWKNETGGKGVEVLLSFIVTFWSDAEVQMAVVTVKWKTIKLIQVEQFKGFFLNVCFIVLYSMIFMLNLYCSSTHIHSTIALQKNTRYQNLFVYNS